MILLKLTLLLLHILLLLVPKTVISAQIDIFIRDDVYLDYKRFLNGRDVLKISSFKGTAIRRDVVDMIIAQQALSLGGFKHSYHYIPGKVNFRNTRMLQSGTLLMSFDSYWHKDATVIANDVYLSSPLIRQGEYLAGIYTTPEKAKTLKLKHVRDFTRLTAVSTPKWRTDWDTLESLHLKELIQEDEWLSMAQMVNIGWVDFMLMPFNSTKDKSFSLQKIKLIPVPNVAIELKDSRHYVISKKHPFGEEAAKAIEKGMVILRSTGAIVKAYTEAGFFINRKHYNVLNESFDITN